MIIKTVAVKIDEDGYPIAHAVLGNHFLLNRMSSVMGNFLVLNEVGVVNNGAGQSFVSFSNSMYEPLEFWEKYDMVDPENDDADTDVFEIRVK